MRRFETSTHGTYFGVVNTGLVEATVTLNLDAPGNATHLPTGGVFGPTAAGIEVSLAPYELLAIHVP